MKHMRLLGLLIVFFGALLFIKPDVVFAACSNDSCPNGNCIQCGFTSYYDCGYPILASQQCSTTVNDTCCHIGGSCTICDTTGACYINGCDPIGGGGDPPPPGATAVPTATGVPTVPGTIQARAMLVTSDTSCAAIAASTTGLTGTVFGFTPASASQPTPQTQTGAIPVTFSSLPTGAYVLDVTPTSVDYIYTGTCIYSNGTLVGYGNSDYLSSAESLTFDVGYTLGTPWLQTMGGDVYASGVLRSYIPVVTPRSFNIDGTGGYPGIVTYGTSADFDSSTLSTGGTLVSSKNWLANNTHTAIDYYDYFYHRFDAPTLTDNALFVNLAAVSKPASRSTPYYIDGDMTTTGDWTVTSGENIVFIVTGNVTFTGNINITGDGFVAFIVNGNISVSSSVGVTSASTASVLDGIYIVSPTGTFSTGLSTAAATARFVGKGMFIAGNFLLQRDLELVGANTANSAELFIYDPQLLVTMPDDMKDTSVSWQEVAP